MYASDFTNLKLSERAGGLGCPVETLVKVEAVCSIRGYLTYLIGSGEQARVGFGDHGVYFNDQRT